jgi:hypothetical protein
MTSDRCGKPLAAGIDFVARETGVTRFTDED